MSKGQFAQEAVYIKTASFFYKKQFNTITLLMKLKEKINTFE